MRIGITLLFGCQSSSDYVGMLNDYVIQTPNKTLVKKKAMNLGHKEAPHFCSESNETCAFIGLYDSYQVTGPLRTGGILGCTSYWSRKTLAAAVQHLATNRQLITALNSNKAKKFRDCLFRAVYLLSAAAIPRSRRRVVEVWILVTTQNRKRLLKIAEETAEKEKVKLRILKILSDVAMPEELRFCGFAEARKVFDSPIRVGGCFLSNVKHFSSLSRISALIKKDGKSVLAKH
jgi:hypothetical protein